jgi:hypothetical protein
VIAANGMVGSRLSALVEPPSRPAPMLSARPRDDLDQNSTR